MVEALARAGHMASATKTIRQIEEILASETLGRRIVIVAIDAE